MPVEPRHRKHAYTDVIVMVLVRKNKSFVDQSDGWSAELAVLFLILQYFVCILLLSTTPPCRCDKYGRFHFTRKTYSDHINNFLPDEV